MNKNPAALIGQELGISPSQVAATMRLLDQGATIPFIARYRKEVTGSLDEVAIARIMERSTKLKELEDRRKTVLKTIEEQGKLTPHLRQQIEKAATMSELEDLYLPYRPKRRTRATVAREKGLEPLAKLVFMQQRVDLEREAARYIDQNKGVASVEEALEGARDIIAEEINEDPVSRARLRNYFKRKADLVCAVKRGKKEEGIKFKDYYDWQEPLVKAPGHRIHAMLRGENEGILKLKIFPNQEDSLAILKRQFVKGHQVTSKQVEMAVEDSYARLLQPSLETEMRSMIREKADQEAIRVFAENLRQLLLSPPLGQKNVLAIDPGFRTGCKVVCLDSQGTFLASETIFPHPPNKRLAHAAVCLEELISKYKIEAIAIGNGTAGRETETFVRSLEYITIPVMMVNESGASIYSASEAARDEFPKLDLTVRGSISIGRRLMDPLAELVKIDPKSIGVGQYQHDVDQNRLKDGLKQVVESSVNGVGVELNTASKQLLSYVSGLGPQLAQNVITYRNENKRFKSRAELKKVPRLGPKAFEQCAGFLRIRDARNPLDASAVHPESYPIVEKMAKDLRCSVSDLIENEELRKKINLNDYITPEIGMPTLKDIKAELARPGRDPREQFELFSFAEGVNNMDDLYEGMVLPGIVTNITRFGAFVDIGVHQDGMVHVSQMADKFVRDPQEVVNVNQKVKVRVVEIDVKRKRISLSMKHVN